VPKVSGFYGIKIYFNVRGEHPPPHFHAVYAGHKALIQINPPGVFAGSLPKKALAMVIEWTVDHRDDLIHNWEEAKAGRLPKPVSPLE